MTIRALFNELKVPWRLRREAFALEEIPFPESAVIKHLCVRDADEAREFWLTMTRIAQEP